MLFGFAEVVTHLHLLLLLLIYISCQAGIRDGLSKSFDMFIALPSTFVKLELREAEAIRDAGGVMQEGGAYLYAIAQKRAG